MTSRNKKIGIVIISTSIVLLLLGTIGYSFDQQVNDVPTPNTPRAVYFADESLPDNPLSFMVTAKTKITWDRSDIFLVIADSDKKDQCDNMVPLERLSTSSDTCKAEDMEYEIVGIDNSSGVEWNVKNGQYYVGIGSMSETPPEDFELNVDYTVDLNLSGTGYFVILMLGLSSIIFLKYD